MEQNLNYLLEILPRLIREPFDACFAKVGAVVVMEILASMELIKTKFVQITHFHLCAKHGTCFNQEVVRKDEFDNDDFDDHLHNSIIQLRYGFKTDINGKNRIVCIPWISTYQRLDRIEILFICIKNEL